MELVNQKLSQYDQNLQKLRADQKIAEQTANLRTDAIAKNQKLLSESLNQNVASLNI